MPREGLAHDLPLLLPRRRALTLIGGAGLLVIGCAGAEDTDTAGSSSTAGGSSTSAGGSGTSAAGATATAGATAGTADGSCEVVPEETAGPFPGDGSNGPDVLAEAGVVREDITRSVGSASGVAEGVPLTLRMRVLDLAAGCSPLGGAAVYAWHCDRDGEYSMYGSVIPDENYLRGVQAAGDDGWLQFTTIFPGCYPGRWPHVHFEVYPSVDSATSASGLLATSQLAFPQDVCEEAYGASGYDQSTDNLSSLSLDTDGIFRDGYALQVPAMSGGTSGYTADLVVTVRS